MHCMHCKHCKHPHSSSPGTRASFQVFVLSDGDSHARVRFNSSLLVATVLRAEYTTHGIPRSRNTTPLVLVKACLFSQTLRRTRTTTGSPRRGGRVCTLCLRVCQPPALSGHVYAVVRLREPGVTRSPSQETNQPGSRPVGCSQSRIDRFQRDPSMTSG